MSDQATINHQSTAALEDFIATFHRFEHDADVFAVRDHRGYPWWDLVRYRLQFALCVERGIFGRASAPSHSQLVRAQSFARQAQRLTRDITQVRGHGARRTRSLIVSQRSLDYLDGVAATELERGHEVLFVNKTGKVSAPHLAIAYQSIQFFTRLTQRTQRLPPEVANEARRLAGQIRVCFDSKVDIFGVVAAKYREELVARRLWSFILDQAGTVDRVVYVNDDTLKSLVVLARARGIDTEEVQHAYMGRSHIGFSYPPLEDVLETLPERVIITRDTGDIIYPVEKIVIPQKAAQRAAVARDIDVLIASSPRRQAETLEVISALVGRGFRLAVKLHPAETKQHSKVAAQFTPEEVTIHTGEVDFCDLAWRARLFIPINATSTTTFEAAEMSAKVVLVDFGGSKTTSVTDSVASARAASVQDLLCVVRAQLAGTEAETGRGGEVKI